MGKKSETQHVKAKPVPPKGGDGRDTAIMNRPDDLRPMSFREGVSLLPVKQQQKMLEEYTERRNAFREWLKEQFTEGVHFGVPPGCEPRKKVDPKQWQPKPSLYQAGALLVQDLLRLRAVYVADREAWEQHGSKVGTFVMKCELIDPTTDKVIGEGRGLYAVGEKQMVANSALKLCEKRALIDAMLHSIPVLADLFTQDMEAQGPNPQPQPEKDPMQPKAPTRTERTPKANGNGNDESDKAATIFQTPAYTKLVSTYRGKFPGCDARGFVQWATDQVGVSMSEVKDWTPERIRQCQEALK